MEDTMSTATPAAQSFDPTPDEARFLTKLIAINPAHQPTINRIAVAFYRREVKIINMLTELGELQRYVVDQSMSIGVHPSFLMGGIYKKEEEYQDDEGFISAMGEVAAFAGELNGALAVAHKKLTRIFCDLKLINESGGK